MVRSGTVELCRTLAQCLLVLALAAGGASAEEGQDTALSAHKLATHMYKSGNFKKAAELYHTAFKIDPQPAFLFNAARSEQRAMLLAAAEEHLRQVLALKGVDSLTRSRSELHLQEVIAVRKALASAEAKGTNAPTEGVRASSPPPKPAKEPAATAVVVKEGGWKGSAGWASLGAGAILAGLGTWLLISYLGDQAALDERHEALDDNGLVADISYAEYKQEQGSLWTRRGLGMGAAGAGLAAMGAGAWMLMTAPADRPVAIVPAPGGATLAWRF